MENRFKVYKHTTPSGKIYIGITGQEVNKRWQNGFGYVGNDYFMKAIKKYGWDSIKHEILFDRLTKEEAESKEIELIMLYKSNDREFGYNIANGGSSIGKHSKETKCKMSKIAKEKNFQKRLRTEEVKLKVAESRRGTKQSEETKRKIGDSHRGAKSVDAKRVIQYDLQMNEIRTFDCIMDIEREFGYKNTAISRCCRGGRPTAYGFIWRHENAINFG